MTESPNPVLHNTNLSYTIEVANNGPDSANGVMLKVVVSSGTTFVSATTSTAVCTTPPPDGTTGTITCTVSSLAKGSILNVVLTVHDIAAAGATIIDTAKVSASTPDPNVATTR